MEGSYLWILFNSTESYNYYEVPETSSTTTTTTTPTPTTTKTTRAPQSTKNYFNDPFFYRYYTSKSTTEDPYKYYTHSSTQFDYYSFYDLSSTTTTTTTTQPPSKRTISPYYFGLNYQKDQKTSTKFYFNSYPTTSTTTTTKTPYVYSNYFSTSPSRWTTASPSKTTVSTTTVSPTVKKSQSSYTRNPVFDVYLKRLASTTKSPYNFENFAQYFKTSTQNPKFSYNLFGANSNNSPLNSTAMVVSTG